MAWLVAELVSSATHPRLTCLPLACRPIGDDQRAEGLPTTIQDPVRGDLQKYRARSVRLQIFIVADLCGKIHFRNIDYPHSINATAFYALLLTLSLVRLC